MSFKAGEIVGFRIGKERRLVFGTIANKFINTASSDSILVFFENAFYSRHKSRVKDVTKLKGKEKAAYHKFLLGVTP